MKLKYFDAHCHITHIGQTILGIGAITNAATFSDWPDIISVSKQGADIYGALGVHPWYLADCPTDWDRILEKHLIENPALMVGEIGLDKHTPDPESQIYYFKRQFDVASNLQRGVIIHCVGMWGYLLDFLAKYSGKMPPFIMFHRYSGAVANIPRLADKYNAYFSYCNPDDRRILSTPLNRILSESDASDLTCISTIADKIALVLDTETTTFINNAQRMLKK